MSKETVLSPEVRLLLDEIQKVEVKRDRVERRFDAQWDFNETDAGASSKQLLVSELQAGIIVSNPQAGDITLTLPDAADVIAGDHYSAVGKGYPFHIRNASNFRKITIAAGTGSTLSGEPIISPGTSAQWFIRVENIGSGTEAYKAIRMNTASQGFDQSSTMEDEVLADSNISGTADQVFKGVLIMNPSVDRDITLPTAAQMISFDDHAFVGKSHKMVIRNDNQYNKAITVQMGAGVTLKGNGVIYPGTSGEFTMRFTNVTNSTEAVDCIRTNMAPPPFRGRFDLGEIDVGDVTATLTSAQLLGGILNSNPTGGAITLTTPTSALLVSTDNFEEVDKGFYVYIRNDHGANAITIAAGTGCTLKGNVTIDANTSSQWYVRYTDVGVGTEAYNMIRLT